MGRKPKVGYYASRSAYYTVVEGVRHKLAEGADDFPDGACYAAAMKKYLEIIALRDAGKAGNENTVALICEKYAQSLEGQGKDKSLSIFLDTCKSAVVQFGQVKIGALKVHEVTDWLEGQGHARDDKRKGREGKQTCWSETTRRTALEQLRSAFSWAKTQGYIAGHCLESVRPFKHLQKRARGRESVITDEEWAKLVGAAAPNFADLLIFLHDTGCRPSEAYAVASKYYNPLDGTVRYSGQPREGEFVWKNAKKTRKDRVIYLSDRCVKILDRLCAKYPSGALFRTRKDNPYTVIVATVQLQRMREKLALKCKVTPYYFRHTFATTWIEQGGSIKDLADMLGTSVTMLERHYCHGHTNVSRVRTALHKVMAGFVS